MNLTIAKVKLIADALVDLDQSDLTKAEARIFFMMQQAGYLVLEGDIIKLNPNNRWW